MSTDLASFYSRTSGARKVIVVDLGFLGDTVHLVPALWEIKRAYPDAALHVLTSPVGAQVLRLVPCVGQAWSLEMDRDKRTLQEQFKVVRALRHEQFDLAFNFSGADRTIFMTALTGARWHVAHPGGRQHFWNRWLVREWAPRQDPDLVVYEQRRRVLAACGLALGPPRFHLQLDAAALSWASERTRPMAIHLSPNSAKATREWPLEHHVAMLKLAWKQFPELQVIATSAGKERERQRLQRLGELTADPRLQIITEGLSIPQLAALLKGCRLHIGPDSGVLHLAFALGVPTVSFFREQGAYKSFMPQGPGHRIISMPCHCVDGHEAPCEQLGRAECFERIDPARVAALVCEQLHSPGAAEPRP
jgi:heptosyltransferase-1